MYFLINSKKKIILGWSAKCGCSHVKLLFNNLSNINVMFIHSNTWNNLNNIKDISSYVIVIFIRNPYHRIISGFLEKYGLQKIILTGYTTKILNFETFIEKLYYCPNSIDTHHFTPQTSEAFDIKKIQTCKELKIFDIINIDYSYLEYLFDQKGKNIYKTGRGGHSHEHKEKKYDCKLYDIPVINLLNEKYSLEQYYNKDIYNKVSKIYENDLKFFKKYGFIYCIQEYLK